MAKERFEEALNKLEKIVSKLEKGDIPLEESLKLLRKAFVFQDGAIRNWRKLKGGSRFS